MSNHPPQGVRFFKEKRIGKENLFSITFEEEGWANYGFFIYDHKKPESICIPLLSAASGWRRPICLHLDWEEKKTWKNNTRFDYDVGETHCSQRRSWGKGIFHPGGNLVSVFAYPEIIWRSKERKQSHSALLFLFVSFYSNAGRWKSEKGKIFNFLERSR